MIKKVKILVFQVKMCQNFGFKVQICQNTD